MLTLGQAARVTGLGKTTLTRAIKAGRLSATRREDGSYAIDPSELSRVYKLTIDTPETGSSTGYTVHRATPDNETRATLRDSDVHTRLAVAEAELRHLSERLEEAKATIAKEEARAAAWQAQAERLALMAPTVIAAPGPVATPEAAAPPPAAPIAPSAAAPEPPRRSWFGWRKAG
jgi:hypothetical protein